MDSKFSLFELPLKHQNDKLMDSCVLALNTQRTIIYKDGTQQTQDEFSDLPGSHIEELREHIIKAIGLFRPGRTIKQLWLFVNGTPITQMSNVYHDHPDYDIGGCYYVSMPDTTGGWLEFKDPSITLCPEEGLLALFNADYWHRVTDWKSHNTRYSIALNCKFE